METTKEKAVPTAQSMDSLQGEQVNAGATNLVAGENNNNTNSKNLNIMENSVAMNKGMKNLLFIEGNRSEIDKANVVESYNKIKAMGFIPTMPIEFIPMEQAQRKLGNRRLLRPVLKKDKGEGLPVISNFKIEMEAVPESDLLFYQKLQQRYNEELETMKQLVPFNLISNAGIKLITKNTPLEVHKYSWEKINSNQIAFFCKNNRNKTKELLRHLRNCIAHSNINRYVINNVPHYKFEDMYWASKGIATYTLKGCIKQDDWEQFVDFIYTESKKILRPQSPQITVKGKIQL